MLPMQGRFDLYNERFDLHNERFDLDNQSLDLSSLYKSPEFIYHNYHQTQVVTCNVICHAEIHIYICIHFNI